MNKIIFSAIVLSSSFLASATDFNSVVESIVNSNPEIKAAALNNIADRLARSTENNLENPEISVETLFGVYGDKKYNAELSQAFDWPGAYKARSRRNSAADAAAQAALTAQAADYRRQVSDLLVNYIGIKQRIANYNDIIDHFSKLMAANESAYSRGEVSVLDINKLRIELADLHAALAEERLSLEETYSQIITLAGNSDDNTPALIQSLDQLPIINLQPLNDYTDNLAERAPEIIALNRNADASNADVKVAKSESLPGFSLGYRYSNEDSQSFNGFTLGLSIPAWGNRGKKSAAQAKLAADQFAAQTAATALRNKIESDHAAALILKDQIDAYGKALITSDNLGLLNRAYTAGQITITDYITDVNYFKQAQNTLITLQTRYASILTRLSTYL